MALKATLNRICKLGRRAAARKEDILLLQLIEALKCPRLLIKKVGRRLPSLTS
jgi:hypothetical protein